MEEVAYETSLEARPAVLVVDDHEMLRAFLKEALEALGFAVDAAGDGEEALRLLEEGHYSVVVCDLVMPKMTGDQLFHACEQRHPAMTRCFIFLSGSLDGTGPSRAAMATGQPCLQKPCHLRDLQSAIAAVTP